MNQISTNRTAQNASNRKSRWGYGIAALYGGFVVFMISIVVYATTVKFDLVADDYYAQEIDYQVTIDAKTRAAELGVQPAVMYQTDAAEVSVVFPQEYVADVSGGIVTFLRQSNSSSDTSVIIGPHPQAAANLPAAALYPGMWRVVISWKMNHKLYITESPLFIGVGE